jgi:hypothetical protein
MRTNKTVSAQQYHLVNLEEWHLVAGKRIYVAGWTEERNFVETDIDEVIRYQSEIIIPCPLGGWTKTNPKPSPQYVASKKIIFTLFGEKKYVTFHTKDRTSCFMEGYKIKVNSRDLD